MRINWSRAEIILVCDLVARNGWRELRPNDENLIALSAILRNRREHPQSLRSTDFRNVNSVSRKSADIMTAHPSYPRESTKGGQLTYEVVQDFVRDPFKMHAQALALRRNPDSQF